MPTEQHSELSSRPSAPVLVVSAADYVTAAQLLSGFVVLAHDGPPEALQEPLEGRSLTYLGTEDYLASCARTEGARWVEVRGALETVADSLRNGRSPADVPNALVAWCKGRIEPGEVLRANEERRRGALDAPVPPIKLNGTNTPALAGIEPQAVAYDEHEPRVEEGDNPKPLDLFRKPVLPPLRADYLPGPLADYVFDQSEIVGSDSGILAISVLVSAAACISDAIQLQPRRHDPTWKEPARLWGAFVGDPSVKKTPALRRAISHLKAIDYRVGEESRGAIARHKLELKVHSKREAEYIKAGGGPDGQPGEAPIKPPERRLIAEDTTVEKLGTMLADNPRGMLVVHDELSGFFGGMDAYRQNGGGKDKAAYLELYNGGPKRIDRLGRESLLVPNWSVCMLGGIQPSAMRKIASKLEDDGLLQRFMLVMAQEQEGLGEDRCPDLAALNAYRQMIDQLYATEPGADVILMESGAIDIREECERTWKLARGLEYLPVRMRYALGKWDGLFCRLALTYHCIEAAYGHWHPGSRRLSAENAAKVAAFMQGYLFKHMRSFYGDVLEESSSAEHAQWIAGYILSRKLETIGTREIHRAYNRWRSLGSGARMAATGMLEDSGWLFPAEGEYGKWVKNWTVNFRVHEDFGALGEYEKARRSEITAKLRTLLNC